ncbi:MAG: radical SAM family heme chaperone HemW [Anaerolineaceae bacterium]|nr:radical SAM family heme chaperone HemW [Anaerolineaceae bacterium]
MMEPHSLYLHIPFCRKRCGYCDFNTFAGLEGLIPAYVQALIAEMEGLGALSEGSVPVHTIFFGGGTPSLLSAEQVGAILAAARTAFRVLPGAEISLEANPGTLTLPGLKALRETGVNRLSLGVQSMHPGELALLERLHGVPEVIQAVAWAREAGFDNLNLDLIYGLPGQAVRRWRETLEFALRLKAEHLSLYALTIEEGTPLQRMSAKGLVEAVDDDRAADMYELAMDVLAEAGYRQYEISNWALTGSDGKLLSCRHNLQYWYNLPYLGLGAGAHGYSHGRRTANVRGVGQYIQAVRGGWQTFPESPANESVTGILRRDEIGETMMVGLRLTEEGVSARRFLERFGEPLEAVYSDPIANFNKIGLLEWAREGDERCLRLTRRGRLLGNQVFAAFLADA